MTKHKVDLTATCGECGAPLRTADYVQGSDIIKCDFCRKEIGTYAEILDAIHEQALDLIKDKLPEEPPPVSKHNKITRIQ